MTERRIEVFFYGLFMDGDLLRSRGIVPVNPRQASLDGFGLRIGKRATLVPARHERCYGMVMGLTCEELETLYSGPDLELYRDSARILVPVSYRAPTLRPTYLSWSLDSRTLYYLALDSAALASIWSIDREGGTPTPLVRFDDLSREWHRYGFRLFRGRFYLTLGDRQSDLWVAEVDAGG